MHIDKRHPVKALDVDTEDRLLENDHYRYGLNGRSGTSDKDGVGTTEGIRGNKLVLSAAYTGSKVIGSCADIKNNAVIEFVYNLNSPITYSGASVFTTSPLIVTIVGPSPAIPIGSKIIITQGTTFVGIVTSIILNNYTLTLFEGTPTLNAITAIAFYKYHHIRRYFESSATSEFITNPALMGSVLNWSVTTRIHNPRIIEAGFTQLLTFTDPIPRLIDVNKMKQT